MEKAIKNTKKIVENCFLLRGGKLANAKGKIKNGTFIRVRSSQ